jgi:prepilin-type N-terminal cleavage/methylation domain-containing protein
MQFLKNIRNSRGFTLIELLVVITIIGILATGGTVTYTSQIQKARDTTRISDMKALQSGIEQFYQDKAQYPNNGATGGDADFTFTWSGSNTGGVLVYVPKLPKDPKHGQSCNQWDGTVNTACMYLYNTRDDANGIKNGEFKLSTGIENTGNVKEKAAKDGGAEINRLEIGINLTTWKNTTCNVTTASTTATKPLTGVQISTATYCPGFDTAAPSLILAGSN